MPKETSISGVLLDFDGVVVDSLDYHISAWKLSFEQLFELDWQEAFTEAIKYRSGAFISSFLSKAANRPLQKHRLLELKEEMLVSNLDSESLNEVRGALDFISLLQERKVAHAIVSQSPGNFIKSFLATHQLHGTRVFSKENHRRPKPWPDPYLDAAKALGIDFVHFSSILVAEDSHHGIESARRANMRAIGISSQITPEELIQAGASLVFANLSELEHYFLTLTS